jgi:peptidyl-prolyl cis-trans isomerase B (cyclophilin B)
MPEYDGKYTVFGQVIAGLDTLDQISAASTDTNDNPTQRIVIKSLKIEPREKVQVEEKPQPKKPAEKRG